MKNVDQEMFKQAIMIAESLVRSELMLKKFTECKAPERCMAATREIVDGRWGTSSRTV